MEARLARLNEVSVYSEFGRVPQACMWNSTLGMRDALISMRCCAVHFRRCLIGRLPKKAAAPLVTAGNRVNCRF
jgi:hypothetical protein